MDINYEIIESLGQLSEVGKGGWRKELNLISWNGKEAKFDIRPWTENHEKMGKGVALSKEEMGKLVEIFNAKQ